MIAQDKTDELITRLADEDPEVREAATAELIQIGAPAMEKLRSASVSSNAEQAARARYVVEQLKWAEPGKALALFMGTDSFTIGTLEEEPNPALRKFIECRVFSFPLQTIGNSGVAPKYVLIPFKSRVYRTDVVAELTQLAEDSCLTLRTHADVSEFARAIRGDNVIVSANSGTDYVITGAGWQGNNFGGNTNIVFQNQGQIVIHSPVVFQTEENIVIKIDKETGRAKIAASPFIIDSMPIYWEIK